MSTQQLLIGVAIAVTALLTAVIVVGLVREDLDPASAAAMLSGILTGLFGALVLGGKGNGGVRK
jgi:hypothetical protein